jgi:glutathione S-transferase
MYTLYGRAGTGSQAVEALLAQCGADYRLIDVPRQSKGGVAQDYLAINPRGEVPSLILPDDEIMTESAGIMIYLADRHPDAKLAPGIKDSKRARYLRWMTYLATTVYMSDLRMYYPERYSDDPGAAPSIKTRALSDMKRDFGIFADGLGNGPFILGERMSAADIYAATLVTWADDVDALFSRHPAIRQLYDGVVAHPAIAAVWKRNGC